MTEGKLITISGLPCSGTTTIAALLANRLGWELVESGKRFRQEARKVGLGEEETWRLDDEQLKAIDREMLEYVTMRDRIIWEGRLPGWFTRSLRTPIRIWYACSFDVRATRYAAREQVEVSIAAARIQEREAGELRLFARLYGDSCNFQNPDHYSVLLDNENTTVDETFRILLKQLKIG